MKGIQVLMLIALFAISTCTKAYEHKNNLAIKAILREEKWARQKEEKRLSILAKEYLDNFDDDIENITNDPRIQIIIDAKEELEQIDRDLTKEVEEFRRLFQYYRNTARSTVYDNYKYDLEIKLDEYLVKNEEYYRSRINKAIDEAELKSIQALLKVYNGLLK
jgi:hypothetical protein